MNHSRFASFPPSSFDETPGSSHIHIPVAALGIFGYALIAVLALYPGRFPARHWLILQAAEIGFACAAFLSYVEAYFIEKWCIYCVWSQAIVTAIVICTIIALVLQHRARRRIALPS